MALSIERWVNKVAVITGASSGIGRAIVKALVEEGLQVVGFARREDRLKEVSKQLQNKKGKFHYVKVDVSEEENISQGFKWITKNVGPVHILVNCAGIYLQSPLVGGNPEIWKKVFGVNVFGLCMCTKEAIHIMNANNIDGHIIHIGSRHGHSVRNLSGLLNVYPATKYAVTALRNTLEMELKAMKKDIRVTSINPGLVKTELVQRARKVIKLPASFEEDFKNALIPEDVAEAVKYIISTPQRVLIRELRMTPSKSST